MSRLTPSRRIAIRLFGFAALASLHALAAPPDAPAAKAPPPVYQDKYIDDGALAPEIFTDETETSDPNRLARSIRVDTVASMLSHSGSQNVNENGVLAIAQWDTLGYGAFTFEGSARSGNSGTAFGPGFAAGGTATLWQRGLAFDRGWSADNGVGVLNSPNIGLARSQMRFYLPTWPLAGGSTEWRGPTGTQLIAGGGVPGVNGGIQVPAFQTLHGSTATVGGQWSPLPKWTLGAQYAEASNVNLAIGSYTGTGETASSRTAYMGAAWRDKADSVQLNVLEGTVNASSPAWGVWLDANLASGRYLHNFGVFRLEPGLAWGNQIVSSDTQGGYYRINYQSRQLQVNAGIDEALSVSGQGTDSTFLTGDARYQYSRDLGFGGTVNVRRNRGGNASTPAIPSPIDTGASSPIAWSVQGSVDHVNPWGVGRAQLNYAQDQYQDNTILTVDQTWAMPVGATFSTTASIGRIVTRSIPVAGILADGTGVSLAAYGSGEIASDLLLNGNLRWGTVTNGNGATGIFANVSLAWRFASQWSLLATYYQNQTSAWTPLVVGSPIAPPIATPVDAANDRGAFLTLRYEFNTGSRFAPLGGRPGTASGRLNGTIFLDANENGRMDAGETVVPNITVVLDGRFSTRTDANGRFDFPFVASGPHVLTVSSDNLPLQWTLPNDGRVEVEVHTRDTTDIYIAATRMR